MKKVFIAIAALLSVTAINAQQVKTATEVKEAIEAAKAATENPKKAAKAATWTKLGDCYLDAYASAQGNGTLGQSKTEVDVLMAKFRSRGTTSAKVGQDQMTKVSYSTVDYYYNASNLLAMMYVTKPIIKGDLGLAVKAYKKAHEVDAKGQKTKEITSKLNWILSKYDDMAVNAYQLGDYKASSVAFERCFNLGQNELLAKLDTSMIYNAAFTAYLGGDFERAENLFKKTIKYNYYGKDGECFVKLADLAAKKGDKAAQKEYLEKGFEKFPSSQGLIVGLINCYLEAGENTDQIFVLLDKAKKNDPKNASLHYVEGTIHEKLGQGEKAVEAYKRATEVNPGYTYGYIGYALYYFKAADAIGEKAQNELNDAKYNELLKEYETTLKTGIPAMEKAYEVEKDPAMKKNIAAYLKNAWFRFRTADDESKAKYEKYSEAAK